MVANPVLVGAVTTLVVVVAVFLSYNANSGLPFVPTRQLDVQIANGANLVKGNEVRSGGFRVGVVTDLTPVKLPDGKVGAKLRLKLDQKIGAIPVDSKVSIRPRSALGLKYVELETGASKKTFADGATMPAKQATRARSRSTRSSTSSTRRRATPRSATCRASATRSPAAAPTSTRRCRTRPCCWAT